FTKQQIPVQIFAEFMPEPGEKAEPIAMGRQTIWGGAGKPPSRDVMAAAAKAARTEMLQRVREKKAGEPQGRGNGNGGGGQRQRPAGDGAQIDGPRGEGRRGNGGGQRANGNGGGGNGQPRHGGNRNGGPGQRPPRQQADRGDRMDRPPRE